MVTNQKVLLITGAAGYVGAMLCDQFSRRSDVLKIIALDKEEKSDLIEELAPEYREKIVYIRETLGNGTWQEKVRVHAPNHIIHTAWNIREIYGDRAKTWRLNVTGSDEVFAYAFDPGNEVKHLVHFSTVASYGAFSTNTIDDRFDENDPFRVTKYLYAEEKRIAEEHLENIYKEKNPSTIVTCVRPAAITGPRGRCGRIRFGLQAALSGTLTGNPFYTAVRTLTRFVPVTKKWCRQFIHEDDVVGIIERVVFGDVTYRYEVFNICPPGDVVRSHDMAEALNKKAVRIHPRLIQIVFFFAWHLSRGAITTSEGSWKSYSYPIAVDGSKITHMLGYSYLFSCKDAFKNHEGRYAARYPKL